MFVFVIAGYFVDKAVFSGKVLQDSEGSDYVDVNETNRLSLWKTG